MECMAWPAVTSRSGSYALVAARISRIRSAGLMIISPSQRAKLRVPISRWSRWAILFFFAPVSAACSVGGPAVATQPSVDLLIVAVAIFGGGHLQHLLAVGTDDPSGVVAAAAVLVLVIGHEQHAAPWPAADHGQAVPSVTSRRFS